MSLPVAGEALPLPQWGSAPPRGFWHTAGAQGQALPPQETPHCSTASPHIPPQPLAPAPCPADTIGGKPRPRWHRGGSWDVAAGPPARPALCRSKDPLGPGPRGPGWGETGAPSRSPARAGCFASSTQGLGQAQHPRVPGWPQWSPPAAPEGLGGEETLMLVVKSPPTGWGKGQRSREAAGGPGTGLRPRPSPPGHGDSVPGTPCTGHQSPQQAPVPAPGVNWAGDLTLVTRKLALQSCHRRGSFGCSCLGPGGRGEGAGATPGQGWGALGHPPAAAGCHRQVRAPIPSLWAGTPCSPSARCPHGLPPAIAAPLGGQWAPRHGPARPPRVLEPSDTGRAAEVLERPRGSGGGVSTWPVAAVTTSGRVRSSRTERRVQGRGARLPAWTQPAPAPWELRLVHGTLRTPGTAPTARPSPASRSQRWPSPRDGAGPGMRWRDGAGGAGEGLAGGIAPCLPRAG